MPVGNFNLKKKENEKYKNINELFFDVGIANIILFA